MARIDSVLSKVFQESASELVFETGTTALIRNGDRERPVYREPLSSPQILGLFAEIAPDGYSASLATQGSTRFDYRSPSGTVEIVLERVGASVRAVIQPRGRGAAPDQEGAFGSGFDPFAPAGRSMPGVGIAPTPPPAPVPEHSQIQIAQAPAPKPVVPVVFGADPRAMMEQLLLLMLERKASDLHLTSHAPVMLRVDGDMVSVPEYGTLQPDRLQAALWSIAPERNQREWTEIHDTDFAHETEKARFRVNVFADRMGIGAVLRQIPNEILTAEKMGLSPAILDLCFLSKGLVLVTGPTGSGKSTTLAAMIDYINRYRSDHIITIEDPVEFVHQNQRCLVNQREIGVHTGSFKNALRAALREDPDIILVGELRDLETISIAIETAETGHLVFGTLHTNTAPSTIDRIIDQFPPDRQEQIRTMLSESLKGVIAQTLCKKIGGGRAAAQEVLIANNAIANMIREGKTFQIPSLMQTGRAQGMVTMNDALFDLVKRGLVEPAEAYKKAVARTELKAMLERAGHTVDPAAEK
ncbi:type IV pilus twitching motility protein PilT [Vulgatibacter incomptus]|uniref:Twitching motility protein PilT n=1 Tax=Vulgatibacter incomptus TaxID=1391653 RepID=A0A0K1P8C0_9BACT|nr:type IV pilus twitching motility protein PilT [Vulgatibacter incomptus]AKU89742.1 Twitching motility protein PilT [Vulgatibacter incomptus]